MPGLMFGWTVIAERRAYPIEKNDLLNKMLLGKDPKTGKKLPEKNIRYNVCDLAGIPCLYLLTFVVVANVPHCW